MFYENQLRILIRTKEGVELLIAKITDHRDDDWFVGRADCLKALNGRLKYKKTVQKPQGIFINPPNGIKGIQPSNTIILQRMLMINPKDFTMIPLYGQSTDPDIVLSRLEKEFDLYQHFGQVSGGMQPVTVKTSNRSYVILPDSDPLLEPIKNAITVTP